MPHLIHRALVALLAALLLLAPALALAAGPPPPPGTGPKIKEAGPTPSQPAPTGATALPDWSDTLAVGTSLDLAQFLEPGEGFEPGTTLRLEYGAVGLVVGFIFADEMHLIIAVELLNGLDIDLYDFGGVVLSLLTPRFGMGIIGPSEKPYLDIVFGVTGLRVKTCTPLCLRGDFRIPTANLAFDMDNDFELTDEVSNWGFAFEFALLF